jgi:hypothetical protein
LSGSWRRHEAFELEAELATAVLGPETLGGKLGEAPELFAKAPILDQMPKGGEQGLAVANGNEEDALLVMQEVGRGADRCSHNGETTGHGFRESQAEALRQGREDEDIGLAMKLEKLPAVNTGMDLDVRANIIGE